MFYSTITRLETDKIINHVLETPKLDFNLKFQNDQDSQFFLADLRDKFFDETSNWCLPKSLIEILGYCNDKSSTIDHCKKISQQVLNRLCTYWLPRYLLSVKLEEQQDENDPDDPSIVGALKNLVATVSRMSSEDLGKAFTNGIDDDPSMNLFFEPSEEIDMRSVSLVN
jgi:hypothetical protein